MFAFDEFSAQSEVAAKQMHRWMTAGNTPKDVLIPPAPANLRFSVHLNSVVFFLNGPALQSLPPSPRRVNTITGIITVMGYTFLMSGNESPGIWGAILSGTRQKCDKHIAN